MRYVIILILLLLGSNAHAQFTPIPINTTEHIGRMIYMGDRILVACNPSWYSVDTNLQTTTELNIPPPYSANIIF